MHVPPSVVQNPTPLKGGERIKLCPGSFITSSIKHSRRNVLIIKYSSHPMNMETKFLNITKPNT